MERKKEARRGFKCKAEKGETYNYAGRNAITLDLGMLKIIRQKC